MDSRASLSSKCGAQHRYHPEACQRCRLSGSSPGLLNQVLHSNKIHSELEGLLKLERHHTTRNCNRDDTVSSGDGNPVNFRFQSLCSIPFASLPPLRGGRKGLVSCWNAVWLYGETSDCGYYGGVHAPQMRKLGGKSNFYHWVYNLVIFWFAAFICFEKLKVFPYLKNKVRERERKRERTDRRLKEETGKKKQPVEETNYLITIGIHPSCGVNTFLVNL